MTGEESIYNDVSREQTGQTLARHRRLRLLCHRDLSACASIANKLPVAVRPLLIPTALAAIVIICKLPTINAPYYWDEFGWSNGAYWLSEVSLLRAIPGLHPPETFLGRPPALHLTLAVLFKFLGPSITTAHIVILCFAIVGICATYLLGRHLYGRATGIFAALCLFLSALYFAQSGMFLADVPITALGVLSIYLALKERYLPYVLCASYMVLIKETSILLIIALLLYFAIKSPLKTLAAWARLLKYSVPLFAIFLFLAWQKYVTGYFSATYDPYALSQLEFQFVRQAAVITRWLFIYQERYIFSVLIAANWIFNRAARQRTESLFFLLIFLATYSFSFIYPYFLPRYVLLSLPYFYLMGAWSLLSLVHTIPWKRAAAMAMLSFMIWSLAKQPFLGSGEVNLRYLDVVNVHEDLCRFLLATFPASRIITGWPHTSELQKPHLGYVNRSLNSVSFAELGKQFDDAARQLREADLILVSVVPATPTMNVLRTYARDHQWRLIKRLEREPVIAEIYTHPAAESMSRSKNQ